MKTTYSTWARVGNNLKIVRRTTAIGNPTKGFRPCNTFVSCTIRKS